jgi:hypothetical protein
VRTRVPSTALFVVVLIFLSGLLAGCGGGGDQSGSGGGAQKDGGEQGGGKAANQGAPQVKIALGTIESVQPEKRRVVLKPTTGIQGGEQMTFNVRKNAEISVNGQEAEMAGIKADQQAQIQYITKNERNRARVVEIVGSGG